MEITSRALEVVEARTLSDGRAAAVIAVNDDVGDGRPISLRSMKLERYMKNPVVLFEHGRMPIPVGRSTKTAWTERGLEAEFEWLPGDEDAKRVRNAWDRGFLRAASIRAVPGDTGPEMVEWSIVSTPADGDAVRALADIILPEGGKMDATKMKEAVQAEVQRALAEAKDGKLTETQVVEIVTRQMEAAQTKATEAAEAQRQAEADIAKREANAEARAELIVTVRELLPSDFDTKGKSVKDVLVAAAGDEVKGAADMEEGYLRAKVESIIERRAEATNGVTRGSAKSNTTNQPPLQRPFSIAQMRAFRKEA